MKITIITDDGEKVVAYTDDLEALVAEIDSGKIEIKKTT